MQLLELPTPTPSDSRYVVAPFDTFDCHPETPAMAVPSGRMRLTVEVLALSSENAHGPNRAAALAEFKGRKFALPVQVDHTFEQVWQQIEERYKKNYLSHLQAT